MIRTELIEDGDLYIRYTPESADDEWIIEFTQLDGQATEADTLIRVQFGDLIVTKRLG